MRITGENRVPPYGALLFLGSFALYLVTLAPGVTFWDSGELIAASHALGIPHQPGYPLYCLIGKASSFVPFGAVAYRYNLLSALLSALAVYVVYLALAEIITRCEPSPPGPLPAPTLPSPAGGEGKRKGPHVGEGREHMSLAAVFAAALAPVRIFWSQAVVAEVYAANALIIASLVLAYARALSGSLSPRRYFALSGLLFGLGVISHASLVLYLPALVLGWALLPHPQGSRLKSALVGMFFIGLGLSVYLYLPVRAAALPAVNLGHPDTLARFVSVVKWGQYLRSEIFFLKAAGGLGLAAGLGWKAWAGTAAALAFAAWLIRRSPRLFLPLFAFAAFYGAAVHLQMRDPGSAARFGLGGKFYMPLVVVFIISAGFAAADLMRSLGNKAARVLLIGLIALIPPLLVWSNYRASDQSRHYFAQDYARNSLNSAGERGVLFTWGDNGVFPLWYVREAERYRDDVTLIHTPLMTYDWYLDDVRRMLGARIKFMEPWYLGENAYRVFKAVTPGRPVAYDFTTVKRLKLKPEELTARGLVWFEGPTPKGNPWPIYVMRGEGDSSIHLGPMERNIMAIYDYQRQATGKQ